MAQPGKCLRNRLLTLTVCLAAFFQAGCEREEPRTYRIPKEGRPAVNQGPQQTAEPIPSPEESSSSGEMPVPPGIRQNVEGAMKSFLDSVRPEDSERY